MKQIKKVLQKDPILNKLKKECEYYWIDDKYIGRCHLDLKRCYFCKDFIKEVENENNNGYENRTL